MEKQPEQPEQKKPFVAFHYWRNGEWQVGPMTFGNTEQEAISLQDRDFQSHIREFSGTREEAEAKLAEIEKWNS